MTTTALFARFYRHPGFAILLQKQVSKATIAKIVGVSLPPFTALSTQGGYAHTLRGYFYTNLGGTLDEQIPGITAKLVQRIQAEPFNLVGTLIFLGAIIHTFLASKFMLIAHRLEHQYHALKEQEMMLSVIAWTPCFPGFVVSPQ